MTRRNKPWQMGECYQIGLIEYHLLHWSDPINHIVTEEKGKMMTWPNLPLSFLPWNFPGSKGKKEPFFLLTYSLRDRASKGFVGSNLTRSFISIFKSLAPKSLKRRWSVNSFPSANSSFSLSDDSISMQRTKVRWCCFSFQFKSMNYLC